MIALNIGTMNQEVGEKLVALGVPRGCRRVVIDIKAQDVVMVYYETFAEQPTLEAILDCMIQIKGETPR